MILIGEGGSGDPLPPLPGARRSTWAPRPFLAHGQFVGWAIVVPWSWNVHDPLGSVRS